MKLESGHFESNAAQILKVLKLELPEQANVLEVASGYGQHVTYFANQFPQAYWQPSDINDDHLASIQAHISESECCNIEQPIYLDVQQDSPVSDLDAIISINLLHVSSSNCADGLLEIAGKNLKRHGKLFLYGPFIRDDVDTAPSNVMFDQRLKMRDPSWGVPKLADIAEKTKEFGLKVDCLYQLPANNIVVVIQKVD
ncbi:MAG: DUF938 domain-containing protein [Gammaproteobacteria bacterium]|nr:DUF938 domain-containing protein [Gammaproteobacteria bacterium]